MFDSFSEAMDQQMKVLEKGDGEAFESVESVFHALQIMSGCPENRKRGVELP